MIEKCDKYEKLFIFATEDEFLNHLEVCEECFDQHSKMLKTSSLVKEVSYYFEAQVPQKINPNFIRIAAGIIIIFLMFFCVKNIFFIDKLSKYNLVNQNSSENNYEKVSETDLPTDEYGLLMLD